MAGAPTKYKEEYCNQLIEHMSQGFSYESFAGLISVDRDTLYQWEKDHCQFSDAKKQGRAKQLLTDERTLQSIILGDLKDSNITGLIFKMKNCHKWRDKHEIDNISSDGSMKPVIQFIEHKSEK